MQVIFTAVYDKGGVLHVLKEADFEIGWLTAYPDLAPKCQVTLKKIKIGRRAKYCQGFLEQL